MATYFKLREHRDEYKTFGVDSSRRYFFYGQAPVLVVNDLDADKLRNQPSLFVECDALGRDVYEALSEATFVIDPDNIPDNTIVDRMIADGTITQAKLGFVIELGSVADGAVTTPKLANGAVTGAKIANGTVTSINLSAGAVTSGKIAAGSIGNNELSSNSVGTSNIVDGAITNVKLATGAIGASNIQDGAVTNAKMATNSISSTNIQNSAVTSAKISLGAVQTNNIQDGAVTGAKIGLNAVGNVNIADGSVTNDKLGNLAVTGSKIANGTITADKLGFEIVANTVADGSISTSKLQDGSVTASKLGALSVGTGNIQLGSVTADLLATDSVSNVNILDGAITGAKIATQAIGPLLIAVDAVQTDHIQAAAITEVKLAPNSVGTAQLKNGAVTNPKLAADAVATGNIQNATVTNAKLATDAVASTNIQNGAVTSGKLATDSVQTIKIQNAAVTNAKLATDAVATGNIQASAVTNAKIASNAVGTSNIADGAVTNAKIADGTITQSKLAFTPGGGGSSTYISLTDSKYQSLVVSGDWTVALQTAINDIALAKGKKLYIPNSTYNITDKIDVPAAVGFLIEGDSVGGAIIKQMTANKPIFRFTAAFTSQFQIRNINFTYNTFQSSSNTDANAIYFDQVGTVTSDGMWNFAVEYCRFENAYKALASNPSQQMALWGVTMRKCEFVSLQGGVSIKPNPAVGQPIINFEDCHFAMNTFTLPAIEVLSSDTVYLKSVEFNAFSPSASTRPSVINISSCPNVTVVNSRVEQVTIATASNYSCWQFPASSVNIIGCEITSINMSGGGSFWGVDANTGGKLNIMGLEMNGTSGSMVGAAAKADTLLFVSNLRANNGFSRYASNWPPRMDADFTQANKTLDRSDANITLTAADLPYQRFSTLTANRTVTLPSTGIYDGLEFTIIKNTTAAFTVAVTDPATSNNITLPAGIKSTVKYRAVGTGAWQIVSFTPQVASSGIGQSAVAEVVSSLPTVTSVDRGRIVILSSGSDPDTVWTCIKLSTGSFDWKQTG